MCLLAKPAASHCSGLPVILPRGQNPKTRIMMRPAAWERSAACPVYPPHPRGEPGMEPDEEPGLAHCYAVRIADESPNVARALEALLLQVPGLTRQLERAGGRLREGRHGAPALPGRDLLILSRLLAKELQAEAAHAVENRLGPYVLTVGRGAPVVPQGRAQFPREQYVTTVTCRWPGPSRRTTVQLQPVEGHAGPVQNPPDAVWNRYLRAWEVPVHVSPGPDLDEHYDYLDSSDEESQSQPFVDITAENFPRHRPGIGTNRPPVPDEVDAMVSEIYLPLYHVCSQWIYYAREWWRRIRCEGVRPR